MCRLICFFILLCIPINSASIAVDLTELPDGIRVHSLTLQYKTYSNIYEYTSATSTPSFSARIKYAIGVPELLKWTIVFEQSLFGSITHSGYHDLSDLIFSQRTIFLKFKIDDHVSLVRTGAFTAQTTVDITPRVSPTTKRRTYFNTMC